MPRLQILAFVWHLSSPQKIMSVGGLRRFIEIARRAESRGVKYTVIENSPPLSSLNEELDYESVKFDLPLKKYEDSIFFRLLTWIYATARMTLLGASLYRKRRFDFIFTPDGELFCMALPAYFAHFITKVPLLFVVQQVPSGIPSEGVTREFRRYRESGFGRISALLISSYAYITRMILVKVYNRVPLIIAVSKSLESQLRAYGVETDIQVVGNGIDLESINAVVYKGERKYDAIFVGRHSPEKGIFDLIDVWKMVTRRLPQAVFVLAGYSTREVLSLINERIKEAGLEKNVVIRGVVSEKEKILLLKQSKIFLYLSRQEAAPLTPAEALDCGLPIICYDIPPMRELYDCDSVIRCGIGDINSVSQRALELIMNKARRGKLSKLGCGFVLKFDWETIAEKEFQIYSNVNAKKISAS